MSRVGETGVGEMGIGETGVGKMGVGEMGPNQTAEGLSRWSVILVTLLVDKPPFGRLQGQKVNCCIFFLLSLIYGKANKVHIQ